jgi:hypothetical protein
MRRLVTRSWAVCWLLLATGCAPRLQLRAVDASSGAAIPSVKVKLEERGPTAYFQRERHIRESGTTDTNGIIVIGGVTGRHLIYFEAPGYHPALVALDERGRLSVSWYLSPDTRWGGSPPMGPWTPSGVLASNFEAVVAVPLLVLAKH